MLFHCEVVLNGHPLMITVPGRGFITSKNVHHKLCIHITGGLDVSRTTFILSLTK